FSGLFGHMSFPFAVVTNNSPLFPRIDSTYSWSVGPSSTQTDKVIHTVETDMVKLVVHIESFGKSSDEIDKETVSFNELQLKQADLSYVHALNELHLH
ncbi:hypothetical protein Tco_1580832, partial [Tanacetum coccineum]